MLLVLWDFREAVLDFLCWCIMCVSLCGVLAFFRQRHAGLIRRNSGVFHFHSRTPLDVCTVELTAAGLIHLSPEQV